MRLTVIVRADTTGLGVQSRNWVRLLNPDKVVIINSQPFNGNEQHLEWYKGYNRMVVDGFIQPHQFAQILSHTDCLLTFEIPYNYNLLAHARSMGVKTILQNNWEFTDYLRDPTLPLPDLLINHSYWHLDDQKARWPEISDYCPSPLFMEDFYDNYYKNTRRKGTRRFLHVAGRNTYQDRNGTNDLLEAVKHIPRNIDFELVVKTQTVPVDNSLDPRVTINRDSPVNEHYLYNDFDAMVLPRRYAGACLPMNEALASGLPVIMTDIEPNNKVLPSFWLVKANRVSSFIARTSVDVYSADSRDLAARMAQFAVADEILMQGYKEEAHKIAQREYSSEVVLEKWARLTAKLKL